jgi:FMN reductase
VTRGPEALAPPAIVALVGNPRARSRTHQLAETLAAELAHVLGAEAAVNVDLAVLGPAVLDPDDRDVAAAVDHVLAADVLVVASPTYKATYSGLLKAFLGAPNHRLAVDVHFTPLLLELGAAVRARGLFLVEPDVPGFAQ